MKSFNNIFLILLYFQSLSPALSQTSSKGETDRILQKLESAYESISTLSYNADMYFKDMASDTFELRKFNIAFRKLPGNKTYGYDWQVTETSKRGMLSIMAIQNGQYWIVSYEGQRSIIQSPLPTQLEIGSYDETMRYYFLIEKVFEPFLSVPPDSITGKDSTQFFNFKMNTAPGFTRELLINKETYLPVNAINIAFDDELGLRQIQEIRFYNYQTQLPDTIFTPSYYVDHGYALQLRNNEPEGDQPEQHDLIKMKDILLNYPFLTETGDILYLNENQSTYLLIDFWYASCEPCLKGLPKINSLAQSYPPSKLRVIGINCFDEKNKTYVSSRLKAKGINMELLFGKRSLVDDLSIHGFPSYILIKENQLLEFINGDANDVIYSIHTLMD